MKIWIFNDASCAVLLKSDNPLFKGDPPKYLVEVSSGPCFEHFFGLQSPSGFPGVSGILSPNVSIDDLAMTVDEAHPKLLFAPNPPVSNSILGSSLANLARVDSEDNEIGVFVEINLVQDLLPWLFAAPSLGLVLDLSVAPEAEFLGHIQFMTERGLIKKETWSGLHIFDSRDHSCEEADDALAERLNLKSIPNLTVTR